MAKAICRATETLADHRETTMQQLSYRTVASIASMPTGTAVARRTQCVRPLMWTVHW